ncbi:hypothetical protein HII36_54125 [Nonomuraea sp. NN258]|uniref:hypothetical protein n=1 Tax=Nonomuraea antri TaxID=2730852 RepID=UPI001567C906|nr:hypothetical protein [Nonomuraea antri]NRQ40694.1 hypothetical protein [Nonomuraea antri]
MEPGYALAGYLVATRSERRENGLPGPDLVSMSECVVDLLPADSDGRDDWFDGPREAEVAREQDGRPGLHVLGVGFAAADVPGLLADVATDEWDFSAGSLPERLARH